MQIYPGASLIECEIVGRPLYLPVLREGRSTMLIDCGTHEHAATIIPNYLNSWGIEADDLTWLVITHPDGDHCGGSAEIKERFPRVQVACEVRDRESVEPPDDLFGFRYDGFQRDHGIFFDASTAEQIRACSSRPQSVTDLLRRRNCPSWREPHCRSLAFARPQPRASWSVGLQISNVILRRRHSGIRVPVARGKLGVVSNLFVRGCLPRYDSENGELAGRNGRRLSLASRSRQASDPAVLCRIEGFRHERGTTDHGLSSCANDGDHARALSKFIRTAGKMAVQRPLGTRERDIRPSGSRRRGQAFGSGSLD